ncbi:MAG: hypothetical protein F6K42_24340 [Leptolyngbya sp. SIO1D8]|nr:hypothetical protein [Leptolyngbya sp. SIO1D8]
MGTMLLVARPDVAHNRLEGEKVEFIRAIDDRWECKHGNRLRLFHPQELRPIAQVSAGDTVEVLPRTFIHKPLHGKEVTVQSVAGSTITVLHGEKLVELALYEVKPVDEVVSVEVIPSDRTERRKLLEDQARKGLYDMLIALSQIREEKLWVDIQGEDGSPVYANFREYCSDVLRLKYSEASNRAMAGDVLRGLLKSEVPAKAVPNSVHALSELGRVPEENRPQVLLELMENNIQPTAKAIKSTREVPPEDVPQKQPVTPSTKPIQPSLEGLSLPEVRSLVVQWAREKGVPLPLTFWER